MTRDIEAIVLFAMLEITRNVTNVYQMRPKRVIKIGSALTVC